MKSSVIAFPRIGEKRELKFASEKYFAGEITEEELLSTAADLRLAHWKLMKKEGIEWIPSGDFSLYDNMLDTAVLLHAVPEEYRKLGLHATAAYFAMARGYQGEKGDVKALAMKKWFNTNYHYIVPELDDTTEIAVTGNKLFHEFTEAKEAGIETKPTMIGPFTFLKLAYFRGKKSAADFVPQITAAYGSVLSRLGQLGADWAAFEEPALVKDLCREDVELFQTLYKEILKEKGNVKVLLQTYFGDIRDCYREAVKLPFDGLGLDFVEGEKTEELLAQYGFPQDKVLFAGVVNGKNIWKCSYEKTCLLIEKIRNYGSETVLQPSCSLLLVPYTLAYEKKLPEDVKQYFSFALEKLAELSDLKQLAENASWRTDPVFLANREIFYKPRTGEDREVREAIKKLTDSDFRREMLRCEREKLQKEKLGLPLFPTTTIGSFPQTKLVKANRSAFRRGEKTKEQYDEQIRELMKDCIKRQEETGLDVLVHGEFERNDMVEYFGENLKGYVFTEFGWVQSYGTRCLKPPIIFGDIKREHPITVAYIKYAQSLTKKPVKGMLTGPVTILNWSFPREDISLKEMAYQIGLAIRGEVTDLEKAGISVEELAESIARRGL
ncbi:MAG TPA: 5-methyltetrahydropteroyltriglutamate--homocysteine S-methyltransferase, partial [Lachnospiraceae bacterium]|nr:5-methyltetrahydropteroyltriglutamate--homocysteine S-methyltransferase [Lachnospiraceae bacterium]